MYPKEAENYMVAWPDDLELTPGNLPVHLICLPDGAVYVASDKGLLTAEDIQYLDMVRLLRREWAFDLAALQDIAGEKGAVFHVFCGYDPYDMNAHVKGAQFGTSGFLNRQQLRELLLDYECQVLLVKDKKSKFRAA